MGSQSDTQIPVDESARSSLRMYKVLTGARNYSDAIRALMEDAGYTPPEGELTNEEVLDRVFDR